MYRDTPEQPRNVSYNGTIILQRCKISRKILKGKKFSTFFSTIICNFAAAKLICGFTTQGKYIRNL